MLVFNDFDKAYSVGMTLSSERLKSFSIVQPFCFETQEYLNEFRLLCDKGDDRTQFDKFIILCHNYDVPYEVHSTSPKSGNHIEMFPTVEQRDVRYRELLKCGYRTKIFIKDVLPSPIK